MRIFIISFLTVGLISLASSIGWSINTKQFIEQAVTTDGIVIDFVKHYDEDGDVSYSPVVRFKTPDNITVEFFSAMRSYPPAYYIGQQVEVFYDPASPSKAKIRDFWQLWFGSVFVGGLALLFFSIGFGMLLHSILRQSTIRRLRVSGERIETKVVSVELDKRVEINNRNPYRIVSQWTKGNEVYVFRSENIWFDPSDYITNDKITVIVDPGNMKKYYVDISFLPSLKS